MYGVDSWQFLHDWSPDNPSRAIGKDCGHNATNLALNSYKVYWYSTLIGELFDGKGEQRTAPPASRAV